MRSEESAGGGAARGEGSGEGGGPNRVRGTLLCWERRADECAHHTPPPSTLNTAKQTQRNATTPINTNQHTNDRLQNELELQRHSLALLQERVAGSESSQLAEALAATEAEAEAARAAKEAAAAKKAEAAEAAKVRCAAAAAAAAHYTLLSCFGAGTSGGLRCHWRPYNSLSLLPP